MKTADIVACQTRMRRMWDASRGDKNIWKNCFCMITHPIRSLRLIDFAIRLLNIHHIVPSIADDYLEIDQSCDTCKLYEVCDLHTDEIGISPCPEHVMNDQNKLWQPAQMGVGEEEEEEEDGGGDRMTMVYIISEGNYEDYHILKVCATFELAEAFKASCDIPGLVDIDEWELSGAFQIVLDIRRTD